MQLLVVTEYYQRLKLEYFISAVGKFQGKYFSFHAFGSFRKITQHHTAAPDEKIFSI